MNNFVKLDVAIELMAGQISKTADLYEQTQNNEYLEQLNVLNNERNKIYSGDMQAINKIINFYGIN